MTVAWIAKTFDLTFPDGQGLLVYDTTKITNRDGNLHLKGPAVFPTTADLLVRLPLVDLPSLIAWDSVDADVTEPEDESGTVVGTVRFRLNDGTSDRWWSGATWAVAGAGNWNTLASLQTNLATFPTTSKKIRLVVELKTTDARYTPILHRARLLVKARVESTLEEVLLRTLVKSMRENVRPTADEVVTWPGGLTANISAFSDPTGLKIVGMDAVLNSAGVDLLSSFVLGTGVITLSSDPGAVALTLRTIFEPVVAVATHSDWNAVERLPAVILTPGDEQSVLAGGSDRIFFHKRSDDTAKSLVAPKTTNLPIAVRVVAARLVDVLRTVDEIVSWVRDAPTLKVAALDESVDLVIETNANVRPSEQGGHHEARLGVKIRNVRRFDRAPKTEWVVQDLAVTIVKG